MIYLDKKSISHANEPAEIFRLELKRRSDKLMNYFLAGYFLIGLLLAPFYNTWLIAIGIGGITLIAYYSVKAALPESDLYQYVLSAAFGIFMAQAIYQMHGLFEMHFLAFIGSAILITYQNWKLQIPILIVVFVHHAIFSYIQNIGVTEIYFTQLDYFTLQTFNIHVLLVIVIFFICGLWAYQLKKYNQVLIIQTLKMAKLQKDAQLSMERQLNAEELGRLNKALEQQTKELKLSNSELEQFAYVASHDLQEPLRMITSFMKRLDDNYSEVIDDKGRKYIQFAVDGAQRMRQIIVDLLEFSRIGRMEDKHEHVDLRELITEIESSYTELIQRRALIMKVSDLPTLKTFKAPIRQVFQNLISNAIKYQKPGNIPEIKIHCNEKESSWEFSVADNGIGIAEEFYDQLFVIFKRLHTNGTYQGTGMGLAVTKKIIENLGGRIWISSEEGKGSTFYFTILKIT